VTNSDIYRGEPVANEVLRSWAIEISVSLPSPIHRNENVASIAFVEMCCFLILTSQVASDQQ